MKAVFSGVVRAYAAVTEAAAAAAAGDLKILAWAESFDFGRITYTYNVIAKMLLERILF